VERHSSLDELEAASLDGRAVRRTWTGRRILDEGAVEEINAGWDDEDDREGCVQRELVSRLRFSTFALTIFFALSLSFLSHAFIRLTPSAPSFLPRSTSHVLFRANLKLREPPTP
jgi:hypothetical protein